MQPVTVDAPDLLLQRCEELRRLTRSHGRWRLLFAGLSVSAFLAGALAWSSEHPNASLVRQWGVGLGAFFALNAVTSALKYRALLTRSRQAELAYQQRGSE